MFLQGGAHLEHGVLIEHDGGDDQQELATQQHQPPVHELNPEVHIQLLKSLAGVEVRIRASREPLVTTTRRVQQNNARTERVRERQAATLFMTIQLEGTGRQAGRYTQPPLTNPTARSAWSPLISFLNLTRMKANSSGMPQPYTTMDAIAHGYSVP